MNYQLNSSRLWISSRFYCGLGSGVSVWVDATERKTRPVTMVVNLPPGYTKAPRAREDGRLLPFMISARYAPRH